MGPGEHVSASSACSSGRRAYSSKHEAHIRYNGNCKWRLHIFGAPAQCLQREERFQFHSNWAVVSFESQFRIHWLRIRLILPSPGNQDCAPSLLPGLHCSSLDSLPSALLLNSLVRLIHSLSLACRKRLLRFFDLDYWIRLVLELFLELFLIVLISLHSVSGSLTRSLDLLRPF